MNVPPRFVPGGIFTFIAMNTGCIVLLLPPGVSLHKISALSHLTGANDWDCAEFTYSVLHCRIADNAANFSA
jgi:hypothetical protein